MRARTLFPALVLAACSRVERAPVPSASAPGPVQPSVDEALASVVSAEPPGAVPALPASAPALVVEREAGCEKGDGAACVDVAWLVIELGLGPAPGRFAARALRRGCESGAQDACGALGHYELRALGTREDVKHGHELLEAACTRRSADACARLGIELLRGERLAWDPTRGQKLLSDACHDGSFRGCMSLEHASRPVAFSSLRLAPDAGVAPEPAEVDRSSAEACKRGSSEACLSHRAAALRPRDEVLPCSVGWFNVCTLQSTGPLAELCKSGSTTACELRALYDADPAKSCARGIGLSCRSDHAPDVLSRGCEAGALAACSTLVATKDEKAPPRAERIALACKHGLAVACADDALARVSDPSPSELSLLEAACPAVRLGSVADLDPAACRRAGEALRQRGGDENLHRALELFRRGCWSDRRNPDDASCAALGQMIDAGEGVQADPRRAGAMLLSACAHSPRGKRSCIAFAEHLERLGDGSGARYWREVAEKP